VEVPKAFEDWGEWDCGISESVKIGRIFKKTTQRVGIARKVNRFQTPESSRRKELESTDRKKNGLKGSSKEI